MSYVHLNAFERGQIQALLQEGKGMSAIAHIMGRDRSTISREIRRNRVHGAYAAQVAQQRYQQRRRECRPARKLDHRPLWDYVLEKLPLYWSPETVAGRLRVEYPDDPKMRISHEALYQALYRDERLMPLVGCLRQARPRRRKRGQGKTRRIPIPSRVSIHERPSEINERSRFGDWEGDLVLGSNQQGAVLSLVGRKSRILLATKLPSKHSDGVIEAIIAALQELPFTWVRSITFDNGSEFYHHQRITERLGIPVYFADPCAAYQRGTNENTNGLLRQYLPKGMNFNHLCQQKLDSIVQEINNRPRKCLGYRSPHEILQRDRQRVLRALRD